MSVISMKQLLEAGVHFGHQTRRWNPKMAPYIFTERNGIHIIDLQKSVGKVDEAYRAVSEIAAQGGTILFVGTKKQAQDAVKTEAERCGMYYVNERWLGGIRFFFFLRVWVFCLHVCLCTLSVQCLQRPEEGVAFSGISVTCEC